MIEALALLQDLGATVLSGGPLSEQPGVFWIDLPDEVFDRATTRLPHLGYTESVDWLQPVAKRKGDSRIAATKSNYICWRGNDYHLSSLYHEDPEIARENAPDRRMFLLATPDGVVRPIRGYRGDGQALSRRGLPVYDARLLVNLALANSQIEPGSSVGAQRAAPHHLAVFLDPFAGIGGIVLEAKARGCCVYSLDVDPALRFGLAHFGAAHVVGDARSLPYSDSSIDAIATEPPYDDEATPAVVEALAEMSRVLKSAGKIAMLCAENQAASLRERSATLPLEMWLDEAIDRKGLGCVLLAWRKLQV